MSWKTEDSEQYKTEDSEDSEQYVSEDSEIEPYIDEAKEDQTFIIHNSLCLKDLKVTKRGMSLLSSLGCPFF